MRMRMLRPMISGALLALPLLAAGCSGLRLDRTLVARQEDWLTSGRTNSRLAFSARTLRPPLRQAWELDLGAGFSGGSPVVADSIVLVGNLRGDLTAVHLRSGRKIGNIRLGDAIAGSPALDGNLAVVPLTGSGESLVAYSLTEGRQVWKSVLGEVEMSPLIKDHRVYCGTRNGGIYCLSLTEGTLLWKYEIPENTLFKGFRATPASTDSLVCFGGDNGTLYAFDLTTGSLRWQAEAGTDIAGGLAVVGPMVVAGTTGGILLACDAATGQVRWRYDAGAPIYAPPVASGDTVYAGSLGGVIHAVRATDGAPVWRTTVEGPVDAAAVVSGDYLYVGTLKKRIIGLLRHDGSLAWSQEAGGRIKTAAAAAFGRLVVATDDHTIVCFVEGDR